MQTRSPARAANDNMEPRQQMAAHWSAGIDGVRADASGRYRFWAALLVFGFSGLVLTLLCGAFLLGLAAVGVVASAVAATELGRALLRRRVVVAAVHQRAA